MNRRVLIIGLVGLGICLLVIGLIGRSNGGIKGREAKSKPDSLYNSALSLEDKGKVNEAVELYQQIVKNFPEDERSADALYKLAAVYEDEKMWVEARDIYAEIIRDFSNYKQISEVEKKLWQLNIEVLFSPIVTDKDITYKVEPGDTLGRIASRHNTTVGLLMRSNNLTSHIIRPGRRLKISTDKYSVIVDKSQNTLALKANDQIFKVYSVATGRYNCTPTGTFTIVEKLKNPAWYKRGKGIVAADSPENVLGTRWLGLSEPQYGIHGGAVSEDLGTQVTDGCVRMLNEQVEELFTILARGTEVTIVD